MNIYFAGSILGGRGDHELYGELIEFLQEFGKVLTEHVGKKNVFELESDLTQKEIYDRDMEWIGQTDCIIAEVSTPSLGVGYEIGVADERGIPTLCLHRQMKVSAMLQGKCELKRYRDLDDAKKIIKSFLDSLKQ